MSLDVKGKEKPCAFSSDKSKLQKGKIMAVTPSKLQTSTYSPKDSIKQTLRSSMYWEK